MLSVEEVIEVIQKQIKSIVDSEIKNRLSKLEADILEGNYNSLGRMKISIEREQGEILKQINEIRKTNPAVLDKYKKQNKTHQESIPTPLVTKGKTKNVERQKNGKLARGTLKKLITIEHQAGNLSKDTPSEEIAYLIIEKYPKHYGDRTPSSLVDGIERAIASGGIFDSSTQKTTSKNTNAKVKKSGINKPGEFTNDIMKILSSYPDDQLVSLSEVLKKLKKMEKYSNYTSLRSSLGKKIRSLKLKASRGMCLARVPKSTQEQLPDYCTTQ